MITVSFFFFISLFFVVFVVAVVVILCYYFFLQKLFFYYYFIYFFMFRDVRYVPECSGMFRVLSTPCSLASRTSERKVTIPLLFLIAEKDLAHQQKNMHCTLEVISRMQGS